MTDESRSKGVSESIPVPPPLSANYVRVMLLDEGEHNVLMQHVDDRWDLPYFIFPSGFNGDVNMCCQKLQLLLGYDTKETIFIGIIELLGEVGCEGPRGYDTTPNFGYAKLLFVEPSIDRSEMRPLPPGFEWKDVNFVSSIEHDDDYDSTTLYCCLPVISILKGESPIHELLPHPPFQPGWFREASDWLVSKVIELGESTEGSPFQFRLSHSSVIVAVNTIEDPIFLKGVAAGSSEIDITMAAVKLFPRYSPELVSMNEKLHSFITRGFMQGGAGRETRIDMLQMLGKIQRESVEHVEYLITAGVPSLKLECIEETMKTWIKDAAFISAMGFRLPLFTELIPSLVTMLSLLGTYNLPMCLVHGDFAARNIGFKFLYPKETNDDSVGMILHDWQFGAISHPFFEFHDYREEWGDTIDIYLEMWAEFETLERAREAYEISTVLGWLLKFRGLFECIKNGEAPSRFGFSVTQSFLIECFDYMKRQVNEWISEREQSRQH